MSNTRELRLEQLLQGVVDAYVTTFMNPGSEASYAMDTVIAEARRVLKGTAA